MRAAWFIKLSSAYTVAISEAKIKKRQMPDPTQGKNLCLWLGDWFNSQVRQAPLNLLLLMFEIKDY